MCEYCEKEKKIEEREEDNIYFHIYGKHLRVIGKVLNIPLGRDIIIEYCPMCRKKVRRVKTEQEINEEIQKHKEAIKNKIGEKTQDDKIHLWIIQTLEWVIK